MPSPTPTPTGLVRAALRALARLAGRLRPTRRLGDRPALEARVTVTFPGTPWRSPDTVTGTVVAHYSDGIDILPDDDPEAFTLFDSQLANGTTLAVL